MSTTFVRISFALVFHNEHLYYLKNLKNNVFYYHQQQYEMEPIGSICLELTLELLSSSI
jgi:hypothetical protein